MDRSDIEEMAKDLIPLAESTNAGEAVMTTDYDDKWEFFMGFRKKKKGVNALLYPLDELFQWIPARLLARFNSKCLGSDRHLGLSLLLA